ncbi:MAG: tRNA (guanine(10)-N(2))-dimethyltransferase, partial [Candidatus Aenigmarchaeota archaeon]|nr:tRNA (guanine(10)-N(2))-dimethyltransferase [Candidatus Aenigmarchaeota archaeon]
MKLKIIKEGNIKIKVPVEEELTRKMSVFYNPEMKFDRDLSEIIVSVLKPKKICDGLAASGVRGLRYANILEGEICKDGLTDCPEVVLNDTNPNAVKLMDKNAKLNSLKIRIENKNANKLLLEEMFDFIDIDPFGSPIYFLDCAAKSIRNRGIVALTATDTAPLCGTSPLTCLRRYGIKSLRTDFSKELGLRILISSAIKHFTKYDIAFTPIFSYCRKHYFRIFGKIERGCKRADSLLKQFDYISYCQKCGFRKTGILGKCENCGEKLNLIGKLYLGDFADKDFCNKL